MPAHPSLLGPPPLEAAPRGGGASRRRPDGRPGMTGVGPIAVSPDAYAGPRRLRLVRAATLSSVMGLAWVSTAPGAVLPERPATVLTHAEREALGQPGRGPFSPLAPSERQETPAVPKKPKEKKKEEADEGPSTNKSGRTPSAEATAVQAADTQKAKAKAKDTKAKDTKAAAKPDPNAWRRQILATRGGVDIIRPGNRVRLVGFHEASRWGAEPIVPEHALDAQHGRGKVRVAHPRANPKLRTMVLPSRGRNLHPASAIDVAMPFGDAVHSPVTGRVLSVEHYRLYGKYPDTRIVIRPTANPRLRVVVLHVNGARVRPGDRVKAGHTAIAKTATKFPFESQIDRYTKAAVGKAAPHVHIEVRSD